MKNQLEAHKLKAIEDKKHHIQDNYAISMAAYLNDPHIKNTTLLLDWFADSDTKVDSSNYATKQRFEGKKFLRKLSPKCGGCYYTNDQIFEKSATAILVDNWYFWQHETEGPKLSHRAENQYWIYWARESATKGFDILHKFTKTHHFGLNYDSAYNFTTSYRRDSDIPYHPTVNDYLLKLRYDPVTHKKLIPDDIYLKKLMDNKFPKSKNYVTWIVSNCDKTPGAVARMNYAKSMIAAGLKFDSFGNCFENSADAETHEISSRKVGWRGKTNSVSSRISKYKFYLDFENAIHCKDYLSEKFWRNSLETDLVPIIFGTHKADVEKLAPKHSFIHTEDYERVEDLIEYLEYLNGNDTAYLEYHLWRNQKPDIAIEHEDHIQKRICGACRLIERKRQENFPVRMIKGTF